jgi:hypothetical protein
MNTIKYLKTPYVALTSAINNNNNNNKINNNNTNIYA